MFKTKAGVVLASVMTVTIVFAAVLAPVQASVINLTHPKFVFDNFDDPFATPNPAVNQSYWWRTLLSQDANGFVRAENVNCNNAACLTQGQSGFTNFAKFSLLPQQYPGGINVVDLTEERNAYSYNVPHRWLPTVNHPVIVSARMKFSSNYKADASGNAVGSHPFWLWNNPLGPTGYIAPIQSFGFNWTDDQTFGGFFTGYRLNVIDNTVSPAPLYTVPLTNVDMNNWFIATYEWSVNSAGVQKVKFYINAEKVGEYSLPTAFPAMTLELSLDNQSTQINPDGSYQFNFRNPSSDQHMYVDYLTMLQI